MKYIYFIIAIFLINLIFVLYPNTYINLFLNLIYIITFIIIFKRYIFSIKNFNNFDIIESTPYGVLILDENLNIVFINLNAENILEIEKIKYINKNLTEFNFIDEFILNKIKINKNFIHDVYYNNKNLRIHFIYQKKYNFTILHIENFTKFQKLNLQLNESQEIGKIGSWEKNLETNKVEWSNEMYNIFEITNKEQDLDNILYTSIHKDDKNIYDNVIKNCLKNNESFSFLLRIIINNKEKIIWTKAQIYQNPKRIKGINQDLTEITNIKKELKLNEKKYEILFKTIPIGILITDINNLIIDINDKCCELYNLSKEELINKNFNDLNKHININQSNVYISFNTKSKKINNDNNEQIIHIILDENIKKYESIINKINDIVCFININGKIIYVNDAVFNFIGYTSYEIYNEIKIKDVLTIESLKKINKLVAKKNDLNEIINLNFIHKNKSLISSEIKINSLYNDNGIFAYQVIVLNNTYQTKLNQTIANFNNIFDKLNVATLVLDSNFNFIKANKSVEKMFNENNDFFINKNFKYLNYDNKNNLHEIFIKLINSFNNHKINSFEFITKKNNIDITLLINIYNGIYGSEKVLIANLIDYTERKKTDKQLIESNERFNSIFFNSHIGIIIYDVNEQIIDINNKFIEILNYKSDFKFKSKFITDFIFSEDLNLYKLNFNKLITNQLKKIEIELRFIDYNNQIIYTIFNCSIINNNEQMYIISQIIDITNKKINEQQLIITNNELIESNNVLKNFAYATSHDLKTPLRGINSFLDKTLKRLNEINFNYIKDEKINQYIKFIKKSINQMNSIINDTLDYSKTNKESVCFEYINVYEFINNFILNYDIHIENNISSNLEILFDKNQFYRLIKNLIDNGIKFNSKENKTIKIYNYEDEMYYIIVIKDNGDGIEEKYFNKIFNLFERLHNNNIEGNGLGLAIVKKIIEKHCGKIEVESELEKGSSFKIYILKI